MSLSLIYITNNTTIALIAEKNGVDKIMIDLETLGKEERQKNMDTVKSHHSFDDIKQISNLLTSSELLVRINPWNENSLDEIEKTISYGANRIMLPMWKDCSEVEKFLNAVNKRIGTTLLLETKEAVECLDDVLNIPLLDEIHIGLNDLHLSYNLTFMFELLTNGTVEKICTKCNMKGISYGFGGIARIGEGTLPAEKIIMEHYRLGSTRAILSRSFCNAEQINDTKTIQNIFEINMKKLREYEKTLEQKTVAEFKDNQQTVADCVSDIVYKFKEKI